MPLYSPREEACGEAVARPDGVDHALDVVARDPLRRRIVGDHRALSPEFHDRYPRAVVETGRRYRLGIVGAEQRRALLDAGEHDVRVPHQFEHRLTHPLAGLPELSADVRVERDGHARFGGVLGRREGRLAGRLAERGRDPGEVEVLGVREVLRGEVLGGHQRGRRTVAVVEDGGFAEFAALLEHDPRRGVLGELDGRGVDAFAADERPEVLAVGVGTELRVPADVVAEAGEADGDVGLGAGEALSELVGVLHRAGRRRVDEHHRLAEGDHAGCHDESSSPRVPVCVPDSIDGITVQPLSDRSSIYSQPA